jgi:hypothetical protein
MERKSMIRSLLSEDAPFFFQPSYSSHFFLKSEFHTKASLSCEIMCLPAIIQAIYSQQKGVVSPAMYSIVFILLLSSTLCCYSQHLPFFIYPGHQFSYDAAKWSFAYQGEWPVTAERDGALIHRSPDLTLLLMFSTEPPSDDARTYIHIKPEWTTPSTRSERIIDSTTFYALEWAATSAPARWIAQGNGWQASGDTLWVVIAIRHGDPEPAIALVQQVLATHRYTTPAEMDLALFPSDSTVQRIDAPLLDSLCVQQENIPCSEEEIIRLFQRYPFDAVEQALDAGDHRALRRMHCELRQSAVRKAIALEMENRRKTGFSFHEQYSIEQALDTGDIDLREFFRFYFDTSYNGILLKAATAGLKVSGELPREKLTVTNDLFPRTWLYRKAFISAMQLMYRDSIEGHNIYDEFGCVMIKFAESSGKSLLKVVVDPISGETRDVPLPDSPYAYTRWVITRYNNTVVVAERPNGSPTTTFIVVDLDTNYRSTLYKDKGAIPGRSHSVWQPDLLMDCADEPQMLKPNLIRMNDALLPLNQARQGSAGERMVTDDALKGDPWVVLDSICSDPSAMAEWMLDSIPRRRWWFSTNWMKCDLNGDGTDEIWSVAVSNGKLSQACLLVFENGRWRYVQGRRAMRVCKSHALVQRLQVFSLARW